jgi:hypothetical protein
LERGGGRLDGSEKVVAVELMEECTAFQVVVDEVQARAIPRATPPRLRSAATSFRACSPV